MAPLYFWSQEKKDGFLSQWYPCSFTYDGIEFSSAEQWMMWSKARLFKEEKKAKEILGVIPQSLCVHP